MTDRECVALLQWALPRMKLRWRGFSNLRGQVCKRISRRMRELGFSEVDAYRALLERDPQEWARFDGFCRITISRFYRDRGVFDALRERFLVELGARAVKESRPLRIWCAGSASGEEPYSLVLVFRFAVIECVPELAFELIATEVDPVLLDRAREASYPRATLQELPADWIARGFDEVGEELRLRADLRDQVVFRQEDLRQRMPDGPFDVVLCRNLAFTYFDAELQQEVLGRLLARLRPGGLLVIGGHERLPEGAEARCGLAPASGALPIFRFSASSAP
jgi:chemotaxis protein methyltransferase CheR